MEGRRVKAASSSGMELNVEDEVVSEARPRRSLCHDNVSQRNWELLRQAFLDDRAPVPILVPEDAFRRDDTHPKPPRPRSAIDPELRPMEATQRPVQSQPETPPSHEMSSAVESDVPNEPTAIAATQEWGSPEETAELNRDIQECLRMEGVASPEVFFTETVESFQSAAHFYIHLAKRLDTVDIDLYESLSSHLGNDHPLVKDMTAVLEREPQNEFLPRTSTNVEAERYEEGMSYGVPGMQAFSEECRALSWVIRTGPRIVNRGTESSAGGHAALPTVVSSSTGRDENRSVQKPEGGQIVCPGLPVSFDGYQMPPRTTPASAHRPQKQSLWSRMMSCLCFAA